MRSHCFSFVTALAVLTGSTLANAQDSAPASPRLRFSGLLGVAEGQGDVSTGVALSDVAPTAVLTGADASFGPLPQVDFGLNALATLGLGEPELCPQPSESCTFAVGGQIALRARYLLWPARRFDPWLSVGGGIDLFASTGETTTVESGIIVDDTTVTRRRSTYFGPLALMQLGFDYQLRRSVYVGGLLGFSLSRYTSVTHSVRVDDEDESSSSGSISTSTHSWLYLAAQATFDVGL